MPRVQALVVRDGCVLMVKHRQRGEEWWCLPGGGQEQGESPEQGALRELWEECCVVGRAIRQLSYLCYAPDNRYYTFLVEIGNQEPSLGHDPDMAPGEQILADVRWLRLREVPERDRAYLWAAGLLGAEGFAREVEQWGDQTSYPGEPE